jgi:hypothetical protein
MWRAEGAVRRVLIGLVVLVAAGAVPAGAPGDAGDGPPHPDAGTSLQHDHVGHVHGADPVALDPVVSSNYDADVKAAWTASEYDGVQLTSDAPDRTALPQIHAIYLYPSDAPNRFGTFAAMFQADARQASSLYERLFGRKLRFDERVDASGRVLLDITVVRSTKTTKQLVSSTQFSVLATELRARGLANNPDKKYLVWLDAKSSYCGQAELPQDRARSIANLNERSSIAAIYRPYDLRLTTTGGFCRGRTAAHELGHALGALQRGAPSAYDGAHCNDSAEDVMCNLVKGIKDTGPATIDWSRNDYWDPAADPGSGSTAKLPWWTVNLSRFLCPSLDCSLPNTTDY